MKVIYISLPNGISMHSALENIENDIDQRIDDSISIFFEPDDETRVLKKLLRLSNARKAEVLCWSFGNDPEGIKERLFLEGAEVVLPS